MTIRDARLSNAFRLLARGFKMGILGTRGVSTLIAVANPSATPVSINVELRSNPPELSATRTLTIPANGQITSSVEILLGDQSINVRNGSYLGVLRVSSLSPISVVAMTVDSVTPPLVTTGLEAIDENAASMDNAAIPQLAVGQYSSQIWFLRGSDSQVTSGQVEFFSQDGSPLDPRTAGYQPTP